MLANRPGSSTRQGRLIFSAPATSPSSGRSVVSLHTRTKLRQFNSWPAVNQPYLRNFSQDLRAPSRPRRQTRFWPSPGASPSSRESSLTRPIRAEQSDVAQRDGRPQSVDEVSQNDSSITLRTVPRRSNVETLN